MINAATAKSHVLLGEAVSAAKLGQKNLARKLLQDLTARDNRNEEAWLWLAALSATPEEAHKCLLTVLDINPKNQQALNALALHRLRQAADRARNQRQAVTPEAAAKRVQSEALAEAIGGSQPEAPAVRAPQEPHYAWHCRVCQAGAESATDRCPRCGALQSLDELEALAHNHAIDEERLSAAVLRLQQAVGEEPAFESCRNLALALLNLNRSAEALPHLRKAHELNHGDAAVAKALQRLHGRRLILAVDDSLTVRKIVTVTLERLGFRVHSAADGMQALAKLNEETPDLVLLDITMPRMDGYQVCKVIRQNEYTKQIPVVMLSGKDGFFDKVKGRLAGATDYLTKPFQEETLRRAVEKHLRARVV